MNNINNAINKGVAKNGTGYCNTIYQVGENAVVNSYRCEQRKFTASDLWEVQKNRKQHLRKSGI